MQFAILNALMEDPGEDQVTLARKVAFDAATFGSVIAPAGGAGLGAARARRGGPAAQAAVGDAGGGRGRADDEARVGKVQQRILGAAGRSEDRARLVALLDRLVAAHEQAGLEADAG